MRLKPKRGALISLVVLVIASACFYRFIALRGDGPSARYPPLKNTCGLPTEATRSFQYPGSSRAFLGSKLQRHWIEHFGLDSQVIEHVNDELVLARRPAFVTGFSDNHYHEGRQQLATLARHFADDDVLVYDLGLTNPSEKHAAILSVNNRSTVRVFNFTLYPPYVRNLEEYHWKPLVILEVVSEFGAALWMDASIHFYNGGLPLQEMARQMRGRAGISPIQVFIPATTSVFAATHPGLLSFFSVVPRGTTRTSSDDGMEYMKRLSQYGASFVLVYGTRRARRDMLYWWLLCALEAECMSPRGANRTCLFKNDRWNTYSDCHRYDQSALSLLLWHANCYTVPLYYRWAHNQYATAIGF